MDIDIEKLIKKHKSKTKADIIDADEMRIIIPVLLREIVSLKNKLSDAGKYIASLEAKRPPLERKGTIDKAGWEVKYDIKKNRLYVKLTGIYNAKSAKIASNTAINILSQTQKNFDVITDASELEAVTDLKVLFHLKKVNFSLQQCGVRKVVRVIDKKNKIIAALFEKGIDDEPGTVSTVHSLEDANSLLDSKDSFLKQ